MKPIYKPQTEWLPPESFPDLSKYDEIAIDLETKDPELKKLGSGSVTGKGHIVGIAVTMIELVLLRIHLASVLFSLVLHHLLAFPLRDGGFLSTSFRLCFSKQSWDGVFSNKRWIKPRLDARFPAKHVIIQACNDGQNNFYPFPFDDLLSFFLCHREVADSFFKIL